MSTNENEIGIVISAQDLTADAINSAKKGMEGLGKTTTEHGDKSSTALTGVGWAAKTMAKELGVGGQEAREFGSIMKHMAGTLSGSALVFGVVGVAAVAAYKIYDHFAESAKKLRDETLKAADASMTWVDAARVDKTETDNLRRAKDELFEVEKKKNMLDLSRGIRETTRLLEEQRKKVDDLKWRAENGSDTGSSGLYIMMYGKKEKRQKDFEDLQFEISANAAKLKIMQEELAISSRPGGVARDTKSGAGSDAVKDTWGELDAQVKAYEWYMQEQKQLQDEMAGNASTMADSQVKAYEWETKEREKLLKTEMDANQKALQDKQRTEEMKQQAVLSSAQYFSSALETMASLGGAYGRKYFEAYKASATAEALISTYQGASKALGQGGAYGYVLAAGVIAAGLAYVARIQAQTYDGGGGGAASGASSSSGSSSSDGSYKYFNYEQSTYGSGWRPGSDKSGTTIVVQGDVYTQDSDQFQKKVSKAMVQSMRNNEYDVNKTVKRYAVA